MTRSSSSQAEGCHAVLHAILHAILHATLHAILSFSQASPTGSALGIQDAGDQLGVCGNTLLVILKVVCACVRV